MQLAPRDLELFARLRVPPELLAAASIERVSNDGARNDYGITGTGDASGVVFPYFLPGHNGHRVTCRIRRDHPDIEDGKPVRKYVAPYGDTRHLYYPPDAAGRLSDKDAVIVFVEAEKSSLAIEAWVRRNGRNIVAVACGGCWGWRGTIGKTTDETGARVDEKGPLPELACAEGHRCIILFDSNTATNAKVDSARYAFALALRKLKAERVLTPNLPTRGNPNVNGPDDFLQIFGDEAFSAVLDCAAGPEVSGSNQEKPSTGFVPWPDPPAEEAFHGVAGEIVRMAMPHTESDPAVILLQFLVGFGNLVGRGPHAKAEVTRHGTNLALAIVGKTSRGRKGTGLRLTRYLLNDIDPTWAANRVTSGLSSGEGLIHSVRDPVEVTDPIKQRGHVTGYETYIADQGETDKRLLVAEEEFARALSAMDREGNTLSMVVRSAWDGDNLRTLVVRNGLRATDPHISFIVQITTEELYERFSVSDQRNGVGNRFLWCLSRRSKQLPEGGALHEVDFTNVIRRLREVVEFSGPSACSGETTRPAKSGPACTVSSPGNGPGSLGRSLREPRPRYFASP